MVVENVFIHLKINFLKFNKINMLPFCLWSGRGCIYFVYAAKLVACPLTAIFAEAIKIVFVMKKMSLFFRLPLPFLAPVVMAQRGIITGKITEEETQEPLGFRHATAVMPVE